MLVTIMSLQHIHTISLPTKVQGQFVLGDAGSTDSLSSIGIEGQSGNWVMKSGRKIKIVGQGNSVIKNIILEPLKVYLLINNNSEKFIVFTEPETQERQIFTKYLVPNACEITIGRETNNSICYPNPFVSGTHAKLVYNNGRWSVTDNNSANGTFVNEQRVQSRDLVLGDTIFIMGLKIVVAAGMIAINNPDKVVRLSTALKKYSAQKMDIANIASDDEDGYEMPEPDYFYRSPRFKRDIEKETFTIDSPPNSPITDELPLPLVLGSSFAMGAMSMITIYNAVLTGNKISMFMGCSMLVGSLLMPTITRIYQKNHKKKKEEERKVKYREYLARIKDEIDKTCNLQRDIHYENNVTIDECRNRIMNTQRNLWERSMGQNDFLRVKVGIGEGELDADFQYNERKFSVDNDILVEELYNLCEGSKPLHNIPINYSLEEHYISGVIGEHQPLYAFAKGMIIQLAALYSYDEVKFAFIYDQEDERELEFVKWLPHVWIDENKFRLIATNTSEIKELSAYFNPIIEERCEIKEKEMEDVTPYYIIFSFSHNLTVRTEMIKQILGHKGNLHMSVVTFFNEIRQLPKECTMVAELSGTQGILYDKNDASGKRLTFSSDIMMQANPYDLSVKLANTFLDASSSNFLLPKTITFLEMFGVGKVEHLNCLTRWNENDPTKSLEAEVGVDTLGDLFKLDLHEKFHGPHGLVAGMTGSGKSEFIITYILSLAVNYHPNEVAFILIDYKGGGMAKSFEKLPHTAGIITNLDGAAIKRSLTSIESELKRRQAIFAAASKKIGESNIDIYKYQKLYREGSVTEPLQHLFIISDEFAELKTSQPEFMTQLVSAARIGRSLGVHLILATQKPSGVVDDQIWSNSKFRVCLRVQDRADSMDMLKRPDAAELTDTGRFYLQVGYNELFEMGQSAWAGAPYNPSEKVISVKDDSVVVIDRNGRPVKQAKIDRNVNTNKNAKKQLDIITDYLCKIAEDEKINIRKLWVEPIPGKIYYDKLVEKFAGLIPHQKFVLNPLIGEYDDPTRQRTMPLTLPLSEEGNVIIYGAAGSGKTTFLNAIVYSLIREHTPDEVNLYLLDFASETLRAFAKAPHVGDVMLSFEEEKILNLIKYIKQTADTRKKQFADYGGDYKSYISSSGKTCPAIVVVVNNFAAFAETYPEYEDNISYLSREGIKYGIYFILAAVGSTGVKFRMVQNFKQILTMQLNDPLEYGTVVGKTEGLYPSKFKGRGLVRKDLLYEFQTLYLTEDEVPFGFIQSESQRLRDEWKGERAYKIPVLPEKVDTLFLKDYYNTSEPLKIPVGVNKHNFVVNTYNFESAYISNILSNANEYRGFICDLVELVGTNKELAGTVFSTSGELADKVGNLKLANDKKSINDAIDSLFELVRNRNNEYKSLLEKGEEPPVYDKHLVIINSLNSITADLDDDHKQKMDLILEKGEIHYGINVILAEDTKSFIPYSYTQWYKKHCSTTDGIWIGDGISNQYQLKVSGNSKVLRESIASNYGYVVTGAKPVMVKLLCNREEETSDEQ